MSDTSHGFGRALVAVYAVFALSATARSLYQLITDVESDTIVPYALSAFAALVYVAATYALARNRRRLALVTIMIELVGVLAVGALSLLDKALPRPDRVVGVRRRIWVHPLGAAVHRTVVVAPERLGRPQHAMRRDYVFVSRWTVAQTRESLWDVLDGCWRPTTRWPGGRQCG
ncbi:hypothetical protein [Aeromicrobium sp. UC242_57]|uniref:hypothetical protein n=1 Tax=Aeromicrobium sp. UC242_57 TaxID=3374624 RepID=UPI0037AD872C